ncbi:MAG: hypothetical protein KGK03_04615 [Candidatus Omnitrophica bacterium]|nr:hypothetical protein [Candidatus Omnitrophota bacterium]MDE2222337.1 hypothetical protein [Candidatus Omnitrophota bacterium]
MFKRFALAMMLVLSLTSFVRADFPSDVTILDKPAITKLTDDQLIDAYENTVVELDASKLFHTTSGFSPKEYKDYKALLKYRLQLLVEIHNRNLEIPQF